MRFLWPDSARAELRAIDRDTAVRILHGLTEYFESGRGDIKGLTGEWQGCFRLRMGDYRVIVGIAPDEITVLRVRHRSDVYR
jgi:mRNA-degrading endonuclease RelE of RelBE toxin-antitoxin system